MSTARWLWLAAGLGGCGRTQALDAPVPAPAAVDAGPHLLATCRQVDAGPSPSEAAAVRAAPAVALAQLTATVEECSDLGGAHLTFTLTTPACGPPGRWALGQARWGGHGARDSHGVGSWAVVGVDPTRPVVSGGQEGWCLESLPAADSTVVGLAWAASEAEGRALLATLSP